MTFFGLGGQGGGRVWVRGWGWCLCAGERTGAVVEGDGMEWDGTEGSEAQAGIGVATLCSGGYGGVK